MAGNKLAVAALVVGGMLYAISGGKTTSTPDATSAKSDARVIDTHRPLASSVTTAVVQPASPDAAPVVSRPVHPTPTRISPALDGVLEPTLRPSVAEPTAVSPPDPALRSLYVIGREVPVRARPNTVARVTGRLGQGLEVGEVARQEGWVKVRHPETGAEGWVSARSTSSQPPRDAGASTHAKTGEAEQPLSLGPATVITTAAMVKLLIAESVSSYRVTRPCACPYNTTRAGRACGGNSAWSKGGGAAPLCYAADVTPTMVAAYRERKVAGGN